MQGGIGEREKEKERGRETENDIDQPGEAGRCTLRRSGKIERIVIGIGYLPIESPFR